MKEIVIVCAIIFVICVGALLMPQGYLISRLEIVQGLRDCEKSLPKGQHCVVTFVPARAEVRP